MDVKQLIEGYASWLKKEIRFEKVGEYYEITTPYLDSANDYIQIYVRQEGDTIHFTDDGATIANLKMLGIQFTGARKDHLQRILMQYGITLQGDELTSKAAAGNFAMKKHLFIQAMLRVDDMFFMAKPKVASLFIDDIHQFFDTNEIFYSDNVQFAGASGFSHGYDFLLQRTKTKPERLCQAVNNPNKTSMGNILFAWNDTKSARKKDSQLIVILNDQNNIARGVEEAFLTYDAQVIRWSERNNDRNLAMLSAS